MENLKIVINGNEDIAKEANELFEELGYYVSSENKNNFYGWSLGENQGDYYINKPYFNSDAARLVTIEELRALVSLHKNPINMDKVLSGVRSDALGLLKDKEYLRKNSNGTYSYIGTVRPEHVSDFMIEIPEGADIYAISKNWKDSIFFARPGGDTLETFNTINKNDWHRESTLPLENLENSYSILWQRHSQPEELPFVDDEDKQEELEKIKIKVNGNLDAAVSKIQELGYWNCQFDKIPRDAYWILGNQDGTVDFSGVKEILNEYQEENTGAFDTQIGGNHYKSLAIQPMQYALENKLDYAQSNVVKYVTRHASKGGKEDLLKAIHNIELMIAHYYS